MNTELSATLQRLHELLSEAASLDREDLESLRVAVREIEESLEQQEVSSASLAERLQESTESFAKEHPELTRAVGQIAETLSQMGI
ncbi:MAG: DUF4404 family protein [Planctomycetota bacterium]